MNKRRLIVRSDSGIWVVMASLLCLGVFSIYLGIEDILLKGVRLVSLGGLLIGGYFSVSALRYILYPKIELTETELVAQTAEFGRPFFPLAHNFQEVRQMLFPRFFRKSTNLDDIKTILIAEMRFLDKMASELKSEALEETLAFWHSWFVSPKLVMPLWPAGKHIPLIFVQAKHGESFVVNTKPFSKAGVRTLIQELKRRSIPITVQPSLGL